MFGGKSLPLPKYLPGEALSILCINRQIVVSLLHNGSNRLIMYPKPQGHTILKDPIEGLNLGNERVQRMKYCAKRQQISSVSVDSCLIISIENGKLQLERKFKADFSATDSEATDASISYNGDIVGTGGADGVLRFWSEPNFKLIWEVKDDPQRVNSLDFHISLSLVEMYFNMQVVAACDNQECRIVNYEKRVLVKRLILQDMKAQCLMFQFALFSFDEQHLVTIKNSTKGGPSFIVVWRMEDNAVTPVHGSKLSNKKVLSATMSDEGMFLGIGCADGKSKIINMRYYDFESQGQAHSTAISSVAFSKDSRFLLSTSSNTYHFLANIRPEGWFSKITKMWVAAMMIFYLLHLVIKAFTE